MAFKNAGLKIALANTFAELYRTPIGKESVIHALYIANTHLATATIPDVKVSVQVTITNPVDPLLTYDVVVIHEAIIKPGNSLVFDKPINLQANQYISILSDTGLEAVQIFASILEELA
jgi:hypothetical protein